mmetsp:Transcript_131928/g.329029  ORF Transcript_131928/g.329029 Transcript_131928/m.329029 type:complete len:282 (+) Transcript_131928:774-1619(+)
MPTKMSPASSRVGVDGGAVGLVVSKGLHSAFKYNLPFCPLAPLSSRRSYSASSGPSAMSSRTFKGGKVPRESSLVKVSSSRSSTLSSCSNGKSTVTITSKSNTGEVVFFTVCDWKRIAPQVTLIIGSDVGLWKRAASKASKFSARVNVTFNMPIGRGLMILKMSQAGSSLTPNRLGTTILFDTCSVTAAKSARFNGPKLANLLTAPPFWSYSNSIKGAFMKHALAPWKRGGFGMEPTISIIRSPSSRSLETPMLTEARETWAVIAACQTIGVLMNSTFISG